MAEEQIQETQEDDNVEVTLENDDKQVISETDVPNEVEVSGNSTASDDDLDNYSKGVQKRIKKLTEKYRYAERDKEEAARLAQKLKQENDELRSRMTNLETGHLQEYGTRLESQLTQAKAAYKSAHDTGDVDAMFNAQQALSQISIEQERYRLAKQRQDQQNAVPVQPESVREPVQQQPVVQPSPQAQKWAEKNEWFGEDEIMTAAAYAIDKQLIAEGFDGTEDEYYNRLDATLAERFPKEYGSKNGRSSRVASASTSASRSTKQGRRTVKLTSSQVAIAKKLGVPLEEYAKYVKD